MPQKVYRLALLSAVLLNTTVLFAADDKEDALRRAVSGGAGKISPSEQRLYRQSIQSTKEAMARETLEVFYRDALDYYRHGRYDEALDLLDRVNAIDPYFEDVATLRESIYRLRNNKDIESKRGVLEEYMRKGNRAHKEGRSIEAINAWKQALTISPSYEPAKKKIQEENRVLAQKQYEAGYLQYHRGNPDEALENWSNAIALDPTFKERGLLLLMSKVERSTRKDQIAKLAAQGYQQYTDKDLSGALRSYEEVLQLDPRHEDARRMSSRIKVQLGQNALQNGNQALSQRRYAEAIKQFQEAIRHEYEVPKAQAGIQEAERMVKAESRPRVTRVKNPPAPPKDTEAAAAAAMAAPAPAQTPADPAQANEHYRAMLSAIRVKDYNLAVQECEIASKLNPTDEHIYVACQRAKQELGASGAGRPQ